MKMAGKDVNGFPGHESEWKELVDVTEKEMKGCHHAEKSFCLFIYFLISPTIDLDTPCCN
jgi:hypothetical protein